MSGSGNGITLEVRAQVTEREVMPFKVRDHNPRPRAPPSQWRTPHTSQDFSPNGFSQDRRQQPERVNICKPLRTSVILNLLFKLCMYNIYLIYNIHTKSKRILDKSGAPADPCHEMLVQNVTTRCHETEGVMTEGV